LERRERGFKGVDAGWGGGAEICTFAGTRAGPGLCMVSAEVPVFSHKEPCAADPPFAGRDGDTELVV